MPYAAGSRVSIKRECDVLDVRGAVGTVYAYATDGTVWISLDRPRAGGAIVVRIKSEHMTGAPAPAHYKSTQRWNLSRVLR